MSVSIDQDNVFTEALLYSIDVHQGQYRDYSKQTYAYHVVRVSEYIHDHFDHRDDYQNLRAIAILHDVLEDTWVTEKDLEQRFNNTIVDGVKALTHDKSLPKDQRHEAYKDQLQDAPDTAHIVKLADIHDNTHDEMNDEQRYQRYLKDSKDLLSVLTVEDEQFREQKKALLTTIDNRLH